jgi:holo-[acyl-carrier protein] synthase
MRLSTGIDLVEINRLEGLNPAIRQRFLKRIFTPEELVELGNSNERLAGGFAVKEAVSKALGCGIGSISWHEIIIHHLPGGQPTLELTGNAAETAARLHLTQWAISISHSKSHAVASAVALGIDDEPPVHTEKTAHTLVELTDETER